MASSKRSSEDSPGVPQRSSGERSEPERSGGTPGEGAGAAAPPSTPVPPDPEVTAKAQRRQYTAEYKLSILAQAEACSAPGQRGALLRREGLYSSHLNTWRRQRDQGALSALGPRKRGPMVNPRSVFARRVAELEAENQKLRKRLQEAQVIIEFQKKVSDVLGIPLSSPENGGTP